MTNIAFKMSHGNISGYQFFVKAGFDFVYCVTRRRMIKLTSWDALETNSKSR